MPALSFDVLVSHPLTFADHVIEYAREVATAPIGITSRARNIALISLSELARMTRYSSAYREPMIITIERIEIDREGYDRIGRYYGYLPGAPVFQVAGTMGAYDWVRNVRAESRTKLRADLKRLFPGAKIGR